MNYLELQQKIITDWNIEICDGDKCKKESPLIHTHNKLRRICNWKPADTSAATFALLTKIGRIETARSFMTQVEMDFEAAKWALEFCSEINLEISKSLIFKYQNQINYKLLANEKHNNSRGQRGLTLKEVIKENGK